MVKTCSKYSVEKPLDGFYNEVDGMYGKDSFIHPDLRWYVNTGSFYKLYADGKNVSGYAERAGYDPNELGYVVVRVKDGIINDVERVVI